ncbi:hypothetical protein [Magnetospira sp. QH-2]|uniref:hypothetical protein n=1 Tax=Magnetospira sp. (strain QH-2) TaxID=1288970 RepID=UPI0011DD957E|nr:hypothetical protein [Magnetospira sp. QH-2]
MEFIIRVYNSGNIIFFIPLGLYAICYIIMLVGKYNNNITVRGLRGISNISMLCIAAVLLMDVYNGPSSKEYIFYYFIYIGVLYILQLIIDIILENRNKESYRIGVQSSGDGGGDGGQSGVPEDEDGICFGELSKNDFKYLLSILVSVVFQLSENKNQVIKIRYNGSSFIYSIMGGVDDSDTEGGIG